jgi:short subunit dehydrogenase-like uncharacterized protein
MASDPGGASGYQAKLVLAELAHRDIDMVLVGRNAARLHSFLNFLAPYGISWAITVSDAPPAQQ